MVLLTRSSDMDEAMPQTVPSAGFTPPCDYSTFADTFDLSLLPEEYNITAFARSNLQYTQPATCGVKPKIYTTYYPNSPQSVDKNDIDLGPDFQKLLAPEQTKKQENLYPYSPVGGIYLEVPSSKNYSPGSLSPYSSQGLLSPKEQFAVFPSPNSEQQILYPSSPSDVSLYAQSPNSFYSDSYQQQTQFIKKENFYPGSPISNQFSPYEVKEENYISSCGTTPSPSNYSNHSSPEQRNISVESADVLDLLESAILNKPIKQESTVDFGILDLPDPESIQEFLENGYKKPEAQTVPEKPKAEDHQLLRQVLRDTSFQRKHNIKLFDFALLGTEIKMEEPDENDMITPSDQLSREKIDPVLNLAIEQMRKDVDTTCASLGISPDPFQWSSANVLSWLQWTANHFGLPALIPEQWDMSGSGLVLLSEEDFTMRAPQGGGILHAQLEIWKAAYSEEDLGMQWLPESTSSNASSGDGSDAEEEEEAPVEADICKPTTSRGTGGSHIHLWQFLKELLASPQTHGSCIRWIDRTKGVFKIEDSVKVARLWGKRKNRPAMNYDKLSRSIRQYYKKGIMKKTERSQRLVYQFCHPYNL